MFNGYEIIKAKTKWWKRLLLRLIPTETSSVDEVEIHFKYFRKKIYIVNSINLKEE